MPTSVRNINDVIKALDDVVDESIRKKDRVGYFAVLYRRVTAAVRDAMDRGEFLDGPRMDRLDVQFGNRYLDALEAYRKNDPKNPVTACWRVAFDACKRDDLIILQHMYLGLSAHLLLDLGIGAAETSPGDNIHDLRNDFDHVNEIVGSLMPTVDGLIGELSPWVGVLDKIGGAPYATMNRVFIYFAREIAWTWAVELAMFDVRSRRSRIATRDAFASRISQLLATPPKLISMPILAPVRFREKKDVAENLRFLDSRNGEGVFGR
jgi:hypothetical protein